MIDPDLLLVKECLTHVTLRQDAPRWLVYKGRYHGLVLAGQHEVTRCLHLARLIRAWPLPLNRRHALSLQLAFRAFHHFLRRVVCLVQVIRPHTESFDKTVLVRAFARIMLRLTLSSRPCGSP